MIDTVSPSAFATESPRGNDKVWAMLCHLSTFLGVGFLLPLVVYLAMKHDSAYARDNAREALNFHLSVLLYGVCCVPLIFVFGLGLVLLAGLALFSLVCSVLAAFKASDGGCYRYPVTLRLVS